MQIDPFARTHQRLRPLHHCVNENDQWVTIHIYDALQRATSVVELPRENRIPREYQNDALDRFALGAIDQSSLVEKRLLDEIAIVINEVRRNPFSL
jgi:hypothetical protein